MKASYETQVYEKDRWKINSISDDRETAVYDAQRLASGSRYGGVRVVEELSEKGSETAHIRVIYRSEKAPVAVAVMPPDPMMETVPTNVPMSQAPMSQASRPPSPSDAAAPPNDAALDAVFAGLGETGGPRRRPSSGGPRKRPPGKRPRRKKKGISAVTLILIILLTIMFTASAVFIVFKFILR